MLPDPRLCGKTITFAIPPKPRRSFAIFGVGVAIVILTVIALSIFQNAWFVGYLGPFFALLQSDRARPHPYPQWIRLHVRSIAIGSTVIQLNGIRSREVRGKSLVLRTRRGAHVLDLSALAPEVREAFVRHFIARRLLSYRPQRPRAQQIALEVFYVYDAHAVLMHKRDFRRILPRDEPWPSPMLGEHIYARALPAAQANPYRIAHPMATAIGMLDE